MPVSKLTNKKISIANKTFLSKSSLPLYLILTSKKISKLAMFVDDLKTMISLKETIQSFNSDLEVIIFPEFDCKFFSNMSPTRNILSERANALFNLVNTQRKRYIFLGTYESLISKTIHKSEFTKRTLKLKTNLEDSYNSIIVFLKENMYEKVDFVRNKGEFSIRGEIVDIYSPCEDQPARLVFDFERLETLTKFDENTQKSQKRIDSYNLCPASEIIFNDDSIRNFRENFRKFGIENRDEFYKAISNNVYITGREQFFPIMYNSFCSIIDYLKDFCILLGEDFMDKFLFNHEKTTNNSVLIQNKNCRTSKYFLNKSELEYGLDKCKKIFLFFKFLSKNNSNLFSEDILFSFDKHKNLENIKRSIKNTNSKYFFCFDSKTNKKKIINWFKENSISYEYEPTFDEKILANKNKITILDCFISSSFEILRFSKNKCFFLSENDFFEKIIKKKTITKKNSDDIINEFSKLAIGDYVVHIDHGVGKFNGLINKKINNLEQDFIEIIYYNNDKLLIPIENLELISKYGSNIQNVSLDKLGLQNWQYRKANVKKKINDIALELVQTAAKRELQKSDKIIFNNFEYEKFAYDFEFTETSDQVKSINHIKNDFYSGKPMDRLICGDVGFGKTEIAMRAAFMVISAGYQVALVCPKVLLVNQHIKTFEKRFRKFNYKIEAISRLKTEKDKEKIREGIKKGSINCILGTHAILSNKIEFNNLGLIIIDEEQSFGVVQKEKLKKLKPNVHILTLTATPIPRTLQSSIFKIRDISLIKTPPVNRLNVKTFLMIYDENSVKKIIKYELDRDGQVFYVTPRIADIELLKKRIVKLFPKEQISFIHGKLSSNEIEKIYEEFYNKKIRILISTAIIESGLDLSNVNTIIIEKPYLFGLAQLYQLRGRVGRSSIQGYAYLVLENRVNIDEKTVNRLKIISKISSLGAGFNIASNDLDMRGGGNIVGSQQSGHIKEVGIELYYKMINEVIANLNNQPQDELDWSPQINLGFSFKIPEDFIKDQDLRMNIYKKISNIKEFSSLNEVIDDLEDRFGKLPIVFNNLFEIMQVKIISKKLKIKKIDNCSSGFVLEFKKQQEDAIDKLMNLVNENSSKIKLMPNSKLMYITSELNINKKIIELKEFLNQLLKKQ